MKRTFLRILPLAVAVLLATSCSKDENNDNAVVNNGQETVQTKTLPISITVNQKGLSKLGCTGDMGEALQPTFEAGDKLAIYNGTSLLKELAVTADNISNDGKTATFEGEIDAEGLVDGQTVLTATIGTPIDAAQTAESREDAVKKGCYQTAEFTYSSTGNSITLEEQNAYIEVVWKNKGGETVSFTIDNNPVSLTLNGQGQGWIVVPAGKTVTCEALDIKTAKTTVKGNIYGITREFSAEPVHVDLGVVVGGQHIYFQKSETYTTSAWQEGQNDWPTVAEWTALNEQCYWVWSAEPKGMYVFKLRPGSQSTKGTAAQSFGDYSTESDPYIFLPTTGSNDRGYYWSSEPVGDGEGAWGLGFNEYYIDPEAGCMFYDARPGEEPILQSLGVVTVRRSSN